MARAAASPDAVTVRLGAKTYAVPRLTLGQIRRLVRLWDEFGKIAAPTAEHMFDHGVANAALVLELAVPEIADFGELECSPQELRAASQAVLEFSGMKAKPSQGEAPSKGEA